MAESAGRPVSALERANQEQIRRVEAAQREAKRAQTEAEELEARLNFAREKLARISNRLFASLRQHSTLASYSEVPDDGWILEFGRASLRLMPADHDPLAYLLMSDVDTFTVLATSCIILEQKPEGLPWGYPGRSHSPWYADIERRGEFHWFETAFIQNGGLTPLNRMAPFAMEPYSEEAGDAILGGGPHLFAWPLTKIDPDDIGGFMDRWANWLALASTGDLKEERDIQPPSTLPWKR